MIHKNIKYGNTDNVTVAEFGKGTMIVVNGGVDSKDEDYHESLLMKAVDTPRAIGESNKTIGMTSDEWKPEMVIAFRNKESFDVFYEFVENIRKRFHPDPTALDLIAAEREKQIGKGYTVESDKANYDKGDLLYIGYALTIEVDPSCHENWNEEYWKKLLSLPYIDRVRIAATWYVKELEILLHFEQKEVTND